MENYVDVTMFHHTAGTVVYTVDCDKWQVVRMRGSVNEGIIHDDTKIIEIAQYMVYGDSQFNVTNIESPISHRKEKRGRSEYSIEEKRLALTEWDMLDPYLDHRKLDDFLRDYFGTNETTDEPIVPISTFYGWRKQVKQYDEEQKKMNS